MVQNKNAITGGKININDKSRMLERMVTMIKVNQIIKLTEYENLHDVRNNVASFSKFPGMSLAKIQSDNKNDM